MKKIIWHGSPKIIEKPIFGLGKENNDYGLGFYCTESLELARQSGVSLRSIQMYEQRNKDINKAQMETVNNLAKALGCKMEDLMEY